MKKIINIFIVFFLIIHASLTAQTISNDFTLRLTILDGEQLQTLYLSDVDFQNYGTAEMIFELEIRKNTDRAYENCYFRILLSKDNQPLMSTISRPFNIPASFQSDVLNNLTLSAGTYRFGQTADTEVHFEQTNIEPEADKLRDEILSSGKAPVGVYILTIELMQLNSSVPLAREEKILLKAVNPSYLNPVAPGAPAGSYQVPTIFSQYPLFQWTGNGSEFQVMVFEKKEMMQSVDDIINSQPNWISERTSQFTIQYPQAGNAIPLEYSKTYYWLVRMFVNTSSGEEFVDSEIWQFRLVNPEQGANLQDQLAQSELWMFLEQLLGARVADIKANLKDFSLKRIVYNGEEITLDQFFNLLSSYRAEKIELVDFEAPEK
ncbi:hypothetical protein Calab_0818 [Caldithrix abyssi DSM 13497]|uniref:Uncharacterized protein n=1 Tax=Caldithrix abyssi DSM 13497 TaxID=880073 RepID=H1XU13_CALAY|nr:hypothetical protein [Caldithrix abyssi]APF16895.1 hypothetical protein Cabys_144 [Caldithrix abyssi DSM 13497]EHO40456.1 hypothetical protein Calab_0818 [Caldithrix abyssi DSM 13497]